MAHPLQLAETGRWTTEITIMRDRVYAVNMRNFSAGNTFATKDEAIHHCFDFGQKIIDGEFPSCDISDL